jgi:hypothetical protein
MDAVQDTSNVPKGKQAKIPAPGRGDGRSPCVAVERGNANELADVGCSPGRSTLFG